MAVDSIGSYTSQLSLTDYMLSDKTQTENSASAGSVMNVSQRNKLHSAYGANAQTGVGLQAMLRAVEELKAETGGSVTFDMIKEYRAELENEFTLAVQTGLSLLGVEESEDFELLATANGEIEILCEDQALKEKIGTLLDETEGMKEQLLYIQALGNIERTKQTLSPRSELMATRADLGMQAVDIFVNAASGQGMGYSSLLGQFTGSDSSMRFLLGANYTV